MCAGAAVLSRIDKVVFGASDPKGGCAGTLMNLLQEERFNHQAEVVSGVMEEECGRMLSDFFRKPPREKESRKAKRACDDGNLQFRMKQVILMSASHQDAA